MTVKCAYCNAPAVFGDGRWSCEPCKAWVKGYPNSRSHLPMGRLAKERLRGMHLNAYKSFERLWLQVAISNRWTKRRARVAAHLWLSQQLGIHMGRCRIDFFGEFDTQRVIDICNSVGANRKAA